MTHLKKSIAPVALLFAMVWSATALAETAIRDNAGLLSAGAVTKATETANSIKKDTGRDVLVETLAQLPADAPTTGAEFNAWAIRHAEAEKASGVYVLIVKSPGKVFVKADKATLRLLPEADADRVRDAMLPSFKERKFDEGVQAGLDEMRIRMMANKGSSGSAAAPARTSTDSPSSGAPYSSTPTGRTTTTPPARPGTGFGMWMCIVPLLIVVVVLFAMRRAFGNRGQQQYGQGYGGPPPLPGQQGYNPNYPAGMPGQQGSGFGRGAMGGLLGGFGGAWLSDRFFHGGGGGGGGLMGGGGGGNQAYGAPPDTSSGSSYSGSSGDFGDTSGGGSSFDSGGGGGGGDFGGGDFGGGGDSGGSSGDF